MGEWDEMCVVCGGPLARPDMKYDLFHDETSEAEATCLRAQSFEGLEWLEDRLGITATEERISLGEYSGFGSFATGNNPVFSHADFCGATAFRVTDSPWPEGELYGLTCHTKCCELLERDLQYTVRFHDVWPMLMQQKHGSTWLECTDYGGMEEYISQYFLFQCLYLDGRGWMLQDPTTHRQNEERILKVWRSIIQSGFQLVKAEPERGEGASSQARNETLAAPTSETAIDESRLQNLHWHSGRRGHLLVDGFIPVAGLGQTSPK